MRLSDDVWALVFLVLSFALFISGYQYPSLPGQNVGAGTFPMALGGALGLCSVLLYLTRGRNAGSHIGLSEWVKSPHYLGNFIVVIGALLFFAITTDTLGYHLSIFICLTVMLAKLGNGWPKSIMIGAIIAVLSHILFYKAFRVSLPWGLLPVFY